MSTVLILGAASDVAMACANEYAKKGNNLFLGGRNMDQLAINANDLQIRYQVKAKAVFFDALAFDTHAAFYQQLGERPDITICVFGLLGDQKVSATNWEECKRVIESNYVGAVSILNVVANDYERVKQGTIVGISSVAGERGRQSNYIYGSAKAGFTAYLSGLRNRLTTSGVTVLTVKPGFIYTKMTEGLKLPKPLTAKPEDLGRAIAKAVEKKKNVIYVLPIWRLIMLIIRTIPEGIFKKLKL
ncbi:MAG: SDR family oxidoreductase [Cyclobacteriaceae bacterium]|nr:SDR family oxidoreductase [Cyclobacteriaceae bacterium]